MKDFNSFTKYHLMVLEEIRNNPLFHKRDNLVRYELPKAKANLDDESFLGKINAVWDLATIGAYKIADTHRDGLDYEFSILILHPEFNEIYERIKGASRKGFTEKPLDWGWYNKKKGEYQFGKEIFKQRGTIRKKVFKALMDIFELSPSAISVKTTYEMTHIKPERLRIEIDAINTRLARIGLWFKGSGEGYYTIKRYTSNSSI